MRLYKILILLSLIPVTLCQAMGTQQRPKKTKPNIIFILTDDLGYGDVGIFYQNQRAKANRRSEPWQFTPNLDALANGGAQLTHFYCNAPVCAPSRASLLLGVHQGHANVRDNQFDKALADNHTMGNVLQKAGYATVAIGKWGLQGDDRWDNKGNEWKAFPLNRGFDHFFGYVRHNDGHEHYPKEGKYRGKKEVYEGRKEISADLDKCFTGDLWTAYAKKWITSQKKENQEKPFFVYLAYDIPHAVLELPTQAYPAGKGLKGGLQWLGEKGHAINTASGEIDSWIHPDYEQATYDDDNVPSTPEVPWPETYKRYATVVRRIDDAMGDIKQLLVDLKIDSNTLIVFSSDNGPSIESYLPENQVPYNPSFFKSFAMFDGIKRDCWEGGVRVPTLVSWPSTIPQNQEIGFPCMSSDWMATFCDVAGIPVPAKCDGVSLMPVLTGKGKQKESTVYVEYFNNQKTPDYTYFEQERQGRKRGQMQLIRVGEHVGVRYNIQSADDNFEIYNVVKDPKETSNLAAQPGMAELQQRMKERVLQIRVPDTAAARPYDQALVSPVKVHGLVPGLHWKTYKGPFPWIPTLEGLKEFSKGSSSEWSTHALKGERLMLWEGYLKIDQDGAYTFSLTANGQALMRVHEALVIDADYGYAPGTIREGTLRLKAGHHPIALYFMKGVGTPDFNIKWSGPGFTDQPIPSQRFFH